MIIGDSNTVTYNGSTNGSVIIGKSHTAAYDNSVIIGKGCTSRAYGLSVGNTCTATGQAFLFGYNCTGSGTGTSIGSSCSTTGSNPGVAIGVSCSATGTNTISIGNSNTCSSSTNGIVLGSSGSITHSYCTGLGYYTVSDYIGEFLTSSGGFTVGSTGTTVKNSVVQVITQTSSTTPTVMGVAGGVNNTPTNKITLTNTSVYLFDCDMIASKTNATGITTDMVARNYKFQMFRGANASTTSISGITMTSYNEVAGIGDLAITADTSNGCPTFTFTAGSSTTTRCVVTCKITKMAIA